MLKQNSELLQNLPSHFTLNLQRGHKTSGWNFVAWRFKEIKTSFKVPVQWKNL